MTDHIKTIREALDDIDAHVNGYHRPIVSKCLAEARAALDSLEAELTAGVVAALDKAYADLDLFEARERIAELEAELTTLRARLAPADSPPVDEELRKALADFEEHATPSDWAKDVVLAAAEARLRSQQPETEEQRAPLEEIETLRSYIEGQSSAFALSYDHHASDALSAIEAYVRRRTELVKAQQPESDDQRAERELGAWLVAHPSWTHSDGYDLWCGKGEPKTKVFYLVDVAAEYAGKGPTRAAAILDALAKARDAEGGKSAAGRLDEVLDALPFGIGRKVGGKL